MMASAMASGTACISQRKTARERRWSMSIWPKEPPMRMRSPRFCAGRKATFRTIDWSRPDIGWCMADHSIPRRFVSTRSVIAELRRLIPLAPLHQPHHLAAIAALSKLYPALPQIACFDTAFHHTQPEVAAAFALPRHLTEEGYPAIRVSRAFLRIHCQHPSGHPWSDSRRWSRSCRPPRQRRQHVRDAPAQKRGDDHGLHCTRRSANEPPLRQPRSGRRSLPDAGERYDGADGKRPAV